MAEYIEREIAKKAFQDIGTGRRDGWTTSLSPEEVAGYLADYFADYLAEYLDDIPTVDVVPVRHGCWVRPHWKNSNYCCDCSDCGGEAMHRDYQWNKYGVYPICPNCGAKMDGDVSNVGNN